MNRYAIENLFGMEGLNIAWYRLIIACGMVLGFAVFTEIYCSLFQTDGRRHCRINHFAVTVTPATLIKEQNFF